MLSKKQPIATSFKILLHLVMDKNNLHNLLFNRYSV